MKRYTWFLIVFGVVVIGLAAVIHVAQRVLASSMLPAADIQATSVEKPVEGWVVCQDLGIGPVPGLPDERQRFILCHPTGWEVRVYCLDTSKPPPPVGHVCSRIDDDTYWCGRVYQPLREYRILATPTSTPTSTATTTPSPTATITATGTPTILPPAVTPTRPRPGGPGNLGQVAGVVGVIGFVLLCALAVGAALRKRRKSGQSNQ